MGIVGMRKSALDRDRGVIATYCPMCRDLAPFTLRSVHQGIGVPSHWIVECTQCHFFAATDPASWIGIADTVSDLPTLIAKTNPEAYLYCAAQCAFDSALADGRVPPTDRECEIRSTLARACASFVLVKASNRFGAWSALTMAAGVFIGLAGGIIAAQPTGASAHGVIGSIVMIFGAVVSVGGGLASVQSRKRRATQYARSIAAVALRPIAPTLSELENSIRYVALSQPEVRRFAKPRLLHAEMAALPDRSWSNVTPDVVQSEAKHQLDARHALSQAEEA